MEVFALEILVFFMKLLLQSTIIMNLIGNNESYWKGRLKLRHQRNLNVHY